MRDNAALKDLLAKKKVTPPVKREAVAHLQGASDERAASVQCETRLSKKLVAIPYERASGEPNQKCCFDNLLHELADDAVGREPVSTVDFPY